MMVSSYPGIDPVTGYNETAHRAIESFEQLLVLATDIRPNVMSLEETELLHDIHDDLDEHQRKLFLDIFRKGEMALRVALGLPMSDNTALLYRRK